MTESLNDENEIFCRGSILILITRSREQWVSPTHILDIVIDFAQLANIVNIDFGRQRCESPTTLGNKLSNFRGNYDTSSLLSGTPTISKGITFCVKDIKLIFISTYKYQLYI